MSNNRAAALRERLETNGKAATAIADRADREGRGFTAAEAGQVEKYLGQMKSDRAALARIDTDNAVKAEIHALGAGIGLGDDPRPFGGAVKTGTGFRGRAGAWAKATLDQVRATIERPDGTKALVSGSIGITSPILAEPVAEGSPPTTVLDLLLNRIPLAGGNTYSYLRQIERQDRAAAVPDAAPKPVSRYTVQDIEGRVRVLAHLSEPVPIRLFDDYAGLSDFLESEMGRGLARALEYHVFEGQGETGSDDPDTPLGADHAESLTGLEYTSGTLVQQYTDDTIRTMRKARTQLAIRGDVPTGWVMHPEDVENNDLVREGPDGAFLLATPPDNVLGPLPVVQSVAARPGVAWLADWTAALLVVRQEATLDVDRSGELFRSNQLQLRLEGRYGLAFTRPSAFVRVDLTGTAGD
ncbi:hypothetical protein GCM10009613_55110 [Pseudonocardia kongjuensis]|uniref:Phage capsid-like C-terminal domain-containing protein n=1 Tax=Pseudonocardia kongjuensis TaxID=102227 RepID=A0ABP4IXF8_9PSEU